MARNAVAYEEDCHAWTQEQARLLRSGALRALDAANLAEEIESIGRSDRRELKSRLTVLLAHLLILLAHLLIWEHQPEQRSTGWLGTIVEQRRRIADLLADSPSLATALEDSLAAAYADARDDAAREIALAPDILPTTCPYAMAEILDRAFMPLVAAKI